MTDGQVHRGRARHWTLSRLLVLPAIAGATLWIILSPDPPGATDSPASPPPAPIDLEAACGGWVQDLVQDSTLLEPFGHPGWRALARGDAADAVLLFEEQPPGTELERIGRFRALSEWAQELASARKLALDAQRRTLDERLESLPGLPGEEVFYFLRASLALQAGEEESAAREWLEHIPEQSPLGPIRRMLEALASSQPLHASAHPPTAAPEVEILERWLDAAPAYARALEKVDCPYPGVAGRRSSELARWIEEPTLPSPAAWGTLLELDRPELWWDRCQGDRAEILIELDDTHLYTVLEGLVRRHALREARRPPAWDALLMPEAGPALLPLLPQEDASAQRAALATRLAEQGGTPPDPHILARRRAWLFFSDVQDDAELAGLLSSRPVLSAPMCPELEPFRMALEAELQRLEGCYQHLGELAPAARGFLVELRPLDGGARRRLLDGLSRSDCPDASAAMRLWRGTWQQPTRWHLPRVHLDWLHTELRAGRIDVAPREAFRLSELQPLYRPLARTLIRASRPKSVVGESPL